MSRDVDDRILAAAHALLAERGMASLTVEAVAERAGVAKTTVYRRYRNRNDVATAALARFETDLEGVADEDDPRAALRAFLVAFARKLERVGLDVLGAMLTEPEGSDLLPLHRARVIEPHRRVVADRLRAAQERGLVRADVDPFLVVELLVGSFFARRVSGREMPVEAWATAAVDTVWRGLAPGGDGGAA
ncbi:TetR/AcrR family transcriptional regulator [Patulibacter sp. SYSU D01012]|uniref:TetR/AcrR family transcriptional regulator n=1 Tax=Patulibacter sp. SYSU D01012 TaxID=2817381 RepID=UPI001B314E10|nr:TetR/AcrR family transcriptional regulator [Patulibacter sp. SYSU D01012]